MSDSFTDASDEWAKEIADMTRDLSMADVRAMLRDMRRDFNEKFDLLEARLRRRSPTRRAPRTSARMTPALAASIRLMAEKHADMPMHEIAAALKVNVGRVSEVLDQTRVQAVEAEQPVLPVE